jgi:hypothetical protein
MRSLWGGAEKTKEAERMDEIGDEEKSKRMEDLRKMLRSLKIKCESGGEGDGHVTHAPTEADMESDKFQGEAIVEQSGSSVTIMDLSELGPVDEVTQRRFMRAYQVPNPHCPASWICCCVNRAHQCCLGVASQESSVREESVFLYQNNRFC